MNTTDHHQIGKASNVVLAGKTARACDSCLLKRARWFCASDDAFLCQGCDTSVHSANQLASRHKRVRLEASSFKAKDHSLPAWHRGFTRKARTPRPSHHHPILPLVPEINGSEDQPFVDESDEQLFFRVPVFDAFAEEIVKGGGDHDHDDLNLQELLSGCDEGFDVEGLLDLGFGITDHEHQVHDNEGLDGKRSVKIEEINVDEDDDEEVQAVIAACHDVELNWNFDEIETEEEMKKNIIESDEVEKRMLLRLNYEAVMAAWDSQGCCPWTDGIRPHFNLDDHEFMGGWLGGGEAWGAAGREARVSRYREKRRTRLFSNKIRYEVRKLNADKRPRIKGRFVKTTTTI